MQTGTDTNGQPIYRERSYSRVKPAAAASPHPAPTAGTLG
ncbi:DUF1659 domain-containing protein [Neomoorella humiferrea]